jgi:hypothetical protein
MSKAKGKSKPKSKKEEEKPVGPLQEIDAVPIDTERVFKKGVMVIVNFGTPGFDRKVGKDAITATDAKVDKTMLTATKKLIECDEFKNIGTVNGKIKGYMQRRSVPTSVGAIESLYMLPISEAKEVLTYLKEQRDGDRKKAVEDFLAAYDKAKTEAKLKLGSLYDEAEYPTKDELRAGFYMRIRPLDFNTPGLIKSFDQMMFDEASQELQRDFQEAAQNMRLLMRETMRQLIGHLAERLSGTNESGKPKIFRESAVTHVTEFLEHFAPRNVTDDAQLAALVDQTKALLQGVDVEALRKPDDYRVQLGKDLAKVTTALDTLMVAKTSRKIRLRGEG